ncbi:hypothetical protein ADUPG1_005006, partial [Aduncisulcus paluster]
MKVPAHRILAGKLFHIPVENSLHILEVERVSQKEHHNHRDHTLEKLWQGLDRIHRRNHHHSHHVQQGLDVKELEADHILGVHGKELEADRILGVHGKELEADRILGVHGKELEVGADTEVEEQDAAVREGFQYICNH